ncbi:CAP domain-containing protein [Tamlana sp. s12]|uniref:CAP domain-containing protein n=1 Tax=Tamlana sp. s12 TaxID=1630406 RepID=UPI0007FDCA4E|nr:CAP domain-containing protein [Tamlana sp. s12]OBQ56978.1 hypothetical protein VQ01_00345 [Tamlana sp. s12]QQY82847.1 CAP domain-containing protein [Tamlana sp. s12]
MKTTYLKPWSLMVICTLFLSVLSCSSNDDDSNQEDSSINGQILNLLNDHRSELDLPTLAFNAYATTLAEEHSLYMATQDKLSYDNYEERASLLISAENPTKMAESVANKYQNADNVVEAMLNDSGHRNNIEADFTQIGIGVSKSESGINYFSFIFLKK